MQRTSRKLTYLTWVTTLAVCGALLWLSFQEPHGPSRQLPDGTTVELAEVTFGREHRHMEGNFWQRLLQRWSPPRSAFPPGQLSTAQDKPVLWLHWQQPSSSDPNHQFGRAMPAATIDQHGCYLANDPAAYTRPTWGTSRIPHPTGRLYAVTPTELTVYPRRTGHFRFALLRDAPGEPVRAEFGVDVPPSDPVVEWAGQPPPVTAKSGTAEFVLQELRPEPPTWRFGTESGLFRCRDRGRAAGNWQPEAITVRDATGNSVTSVSTNRPQPERMYFSGLCRREPAWRMQVRFVRKAPVRSAAAFVWTPPALTAPTAGQQFAPHPAPAQWGGVRLELTHTVGIGTAAWSGGGGYFDKPTVVLSARASDSRFAIGLIEAHDERGHALPTSGPRLRTLLPGEHEYQFALNYPRRTGKLHLTFGLFETHTVEFLVKPN